MASIISWGLKLAIDSFFFGGGGEGCRNSMVRALADISGSTTKVPGSMASGV